jgi:hypothetical protein
MPLGFDVSVVLFMSRFGVSFYLITPHPLPTLSGCWLTRLEMWLPLTARKVWPDQVREAKQSEKEGSDKVWMSALCSVGVISVIVVYVSLDYHVDDIDIP